MKIQNILLVLSSAAIGEAAVCWTNGFNMLTGGKPWGPGCQSSLPVKPAPAKPAPAKPAPAPQKVTVVQSFTATVTTTLTTTSTETSTTTNTVTSTDTVTTTDTVTSTDTVTTTDTVTSTSTITEHRINPTDAAAAMAACLAMNPTYTMPLFDSNGDPQCCGPVKCGKTQICP